MTQVDPQTWNELMAFLTALEDKKAREREDRRPQLDLPIEERIELPIQEEEPDDGEN